MWYPERANAGLKVVGDGVCLEEGMVCDGAEGVALVAELFLQLDRLLETGSFGWRLGTGIEQCSVGGICSHQTALLHLECTCMGTCTSSFHIMLLM